MNSISERIKFLRESKNISMNKLEDSIGAPRGSVNKWEKGSIPGGNNLIALSDFFQVSTDWILKGTQQQEEMTPGKEVSHGTSLFFDEKRVSTSHFEEMLQSLDESDRAFIDRYIQFAIFQKQSTSSVSKNEVPSNEVKPHNPISIVQSDSNNTKSTIPILGRAAAGVPIELVRFIEGYLQVQEKFKNCFAVKVQGESMIKAGIDNGGYVVVRQQEWVENNDIALVKVEDGVTIKRFKKQNNLAYLISENDNMKTMVYDPKENDMQILGLIVDIISPAQAAKLVVDEL